MAGLSGRKLAELLELPQVRISRFERGEAVPSMPEVMRWADAIEADAPTRAILRRLTAAAHTDVTRHRDTIGVHGHLQGAVEADEAGSGLTRSYTNEVVPGLLQTAAYAQAVFALVDKGSAMDQAAALSGRLRRQEALYDQSRRFEFLIQEATLRWQPGAPGLLVAQLDRIASLSTLGNVALGIIPSRVQAPALPYSSYAMHIERTDDGDASVSVELVHGSMIVSDPDDLTRYAEHWAAWADVAYWGSDTRTHLGRLADEVRDGG